MACEWVEQSHPTWVRGLKLVVRHRPHQVLVAPYVGAWIETRLRVCRTSWHGLVAPYVGAWIETLSHPSRSEESAVAPYVGAWIETR